MFQPIPPGSLLAGGRYRVLGLLGTGGMGAVYQAENVTTLKRVAIKCLRSQVDAKDVQRKRLVREAKAAARIRHLNVVDVYDVIETEGFVCLIMEFLDGEPLSALLERERLSVERALALLFPVLRGVAAAHRSQVIHRDLKPANIFIARVEDGIGVRPRVRTTNTRRDDKRERQADQRSPCSTFGRRSARSTRPPSS